ncbi:MAG: hypothetical protein OXF01_04535 [Gemmatimonadetes bacterium]|nr:hypothetical protein [Gemmatimonadota bacterium]
MTIGEWIDGRVRPVPVEFRPHLSVGGPVSPDGLLAAAERKFTDCAVDSPRDRGAAFSLLAADACVTYACTLAMTEDADASTLRGAARRVAHGWWDSLP